MEPGRDGRGRVMVGTAGWSVPAPHAGAFPREGSHLARYAGRFRAVEINSSFHRPHRASTYARWAATVPAGFRFSVKLPKAITHAARLVDATGALDRFLSETAALGETRGPLLVQLPPSLAFDAKVAGAFLGALRAHFGGAVAWEPRHPSWFGPAPERLLADHEVARVAADPAVVPAAAEPGGWDGFAYHRLHGSPRIYRSAYTPEFVAALARRLAAPAWCIFDNTAEGAATADALAVRDALG